MMSRSFSKGYFLGRGVVKKVSSKRSSDEIVDEDLIAAAGEDPMDIPQFNGEFEIPPSIDPVAAIPDGFFDPALLGSLDASQVRDDILTALNYLMGIYPPDTLNFTLDWYLFDFAMGTEPQFVESLAALTPDNLAELYSKMVLLAVEQGLPYESFTYYTTLLNAPPVSLESAPASVDPTVPVIESRKRRKSIDEEEKKDPDKEEKDKEKEGEEEDDPSKKKKTDEEEKKDPDKEEKDKEKDPEKKADEAECPEGDDDEDEEDKKKKDGLQEGPPQSVICKRCGRGIPTQTMVGATFCPYCGYKYEEPSNKNIQSSSQVTAATQHGWDSLKKGDSLRVDVIGDVRGIFYISINGTKYGYEADGNVIEKFLALLRHNGGKALAYLKENSKLAFGSKNWSAGSSWESLDFTKFKVNLGAYIWHKGDQYYIGTLNGKKFSVKDKQAFPVQISSRFGDMEKTLFYSKEAGEMPIAISVSNVEAFHILMDRATDDVNEYRYNLSRYFVSFTAKDSTRIMIPVVDAVDPLPGAPKESETTPASPAGESGGDIVGSTVIGPEHGETTQPVETAGEPEKKEDPIAGEGGDYVGGDNAPPDDTDTITKDGGADTIGGDKAPPDTAPGILKADQKGKRESIRRRRALLDQEEKDLEDKEEKDKKEKDKEKTDEEISKTNQLAAEAEALKVDPPYEEENDGDPELEKKDPIAGQGGEIIKAEAPPNSAPKTSDGLKIPGAKKRSDSMKISSGGSRTTHLIDFGKDPAAVVQAKIPEVKRWLQSNVKVGESAELSSDVNGPEHWVIFNRVNTSVLWTIEDLSNSKSREIEYGINNFMEMFEE